MKHQTYTVTYEYLPKDAARKRENIKTHTEEIFADNVEEINQYLKECFEETGVLYEGWQYYKILGISKVLDVYNELELKGLIIECPENFSLYRL